MQSAVTSQTVARVASDHRGGVGDSDRGDGGSVGDHLGGADLGVVADDS